MLDQIPRRLRSAVANTLVGAQFTLLAMIGVLAIHKISTTTHAYLDFEIGSVVLGSLVIVSAGFALRPALRISPIPKGDAPLIESGIYKRVRHPMYLGVILIGFGAAGHADSTASWVLEGLLIITLNVKARFEDALLMELHPESAHYQMHVSRILPCVGSSCRTNCQLD